MYSRQLGPEINKTRTKCFLNFLKSSGTNTNIQDVTNSSADWEDFWYNEDVDQDEINHYKELEESMELFR